MKWQCRWLGVLTLQELWCHQHFLRATTSHPVPLHRQRRHRVANHTFHVENLQRYQLDPKITLYQPDPRLGTSVHLQLVIPNHNSRQQVHQLTSGLDHHHPRTLPRQVHHHLHDHKSRPTRRHLLPNQHQSLKQLRLQHKRHHHPHKRRLHPLLQNQRKQSPNLKLQRRPLLRQKKTPQKNNKTHTKHRTAHLQRNPPLLRNL